MPQSWEQYERGQEAAALGSAMVAALAELYGCEPQVESVKRAVYKATDCGAFVVFPSDAPCRVGVGSIVEGSDAEVPPIFVTYNEDKPDEQFIAEWRKAVQHVEDEADCLWREANEET